MKTPSPKNIHKSSSLLLSDHDTIIKNKKGKINYNGHYHLTSFGNKKSKHNKIQSEIIIYKKNNKRLYLCLDKVSSISSLSNDVTDSYYILFLQIILYLFFLFIFLFN